MLSNVDNVAIERYLAETGITEDHIQVKKRNSLMEKLHSIVREFIKDVARHKFLRRDDFECQLMPFGSYGLGGYLTGADMDLVLLAAKGIERRDFYTEFRKLLKRLTEDIEVIKRTAVPIIKCTIDTIPVDISFVSFSLSSVPKNINLLNDTLLYGLDKECLASMDGPRTQQFLLDNIQPNHLATFQSTLQCIKHWATCRKIYGKPMGYLNGSTWTFLLMKTYMSIPLRSGIQMNTYSLLSMFFEMWASWPWPEPVKLSSHIPGLQGAILDFEDIEDFRHSVMPIVSPCYPVCSSTPFATASTLRVMTLEFKRAQTIMKFNEYLDINHLLTRLFMELNFFAQYLHFLRIEVTSETVKSNETWQRKMATAIPKLVGLLEVNPSITFIHPYTQTYTESRSYSTVQGKLAIQEGYSDYIENYVSSLQPGKLHITTHIIGLQVLAPTQGKEVDVSHEVQEFLQELEAKRNDRDADVTFRITSAKRYCLFTMK
ncbi:Poly(A) polymerase central domain-containing protein [Phascolomyces articulosus]|uniref:polynucleotide adenylyltransferase n=1 Tax=Phascolomyces articulosus TaxID=60185 RepID=A0AAD5JLY7_9FUNG|nr:Poly(A) polymerase central domain-containing protein [Phascolomyces articulosus]